ncbi:MAG: septum formation initiator family protein [Candidatus Levybacteria bacterium]|nr:septum formation initiator family protein [Candidatus Levybacteria bacterium]
MRFVNTKTVILLIIIVVLLLVIKNIVASIISLRQNSQIVTSLKQQEILEKEKKRFLQQQFYYVTTPQFIENEAREKLGMVKPGEHIVLAPPPSEPQKQPDTTDYSPNWKKWWRLFF